LVFNAGTPVTLERFLKWKEDRRIKKGKRRIRTFTKRSR